MYNTRRRKIVYITKNIKIDYLLLKLRFIAATETFLYGNVPKNKFRFKILFPYDFGCLSSLVPIKEKYDTNLMIRYLLSVDECRICY